FIVPATLFVRERPLPVRVDKTTIHLEVVLKLLERFVITTSDVEQQSDIRRDRQREWIKLVRLSQLRNRFIELAHRGQIDKSIPVMRNRITWFQVERTFEFPFRRFPIPIVTGEAVSERRVSFCQRVVEFERTL